MQDYQVYVLSRGAELMAARRLLAGSDSIALAKMASIKGRGRFEIWQGDRLVARLYDRAPARR